MRGITKYQLEVLLIAKDVHTQTGMNVDLDQILERLSWKPTKESAQFTIRAVISKGFICKTGTETRRGRNRICFGITASGSHLLDPRKAIESSSEIPEILSIPGVIVLPEFEEKLMDLDSFSSESTRET